MAIMTIAHKARQKEDSPIGPGLESDTATLFAATGQGWESSG
jgi:hypothetical protein